MRHWSLAVFPHTQSSGKQHSRFALLLFSETQLCNRLCFVLQDGWVQAGETEGNCVSFREKKNSEKHPQPGNRSAHAHGFMSSWDLRDWTTGRRIYADSELLISHTLPCWDATNTYTVSGFSHLSRAIYMQGTESFGSHSKLKTWFFLANVIFTNCGVCARACV